MKTVFPPVFGCEMLCVVSNSGGKMHHFTAAIISQLDHCVPARYRLLALLLSVSFLLFNGMSEHVPLLLQFTFHWTLAMTGHSH